jgi:hypothetical protein
MNCSYLTLADNLVNEAQMGSIIGFYLPSPSGKVFLELVNRTDLAFTQFAISGQAKLLDGVPLSYQRMMTVPQWQGHLVRASISCSKPVLLI